MPKETEYEFSLDAYFDEQAKEWVSSAGYTDGTDLQEHRTWKHPSLAVVMRMAEVYLIARVALVTGKEATPKVKTPKHNSRQETLF